MGAGSGCVEFKRKELSSQLAKNGRKKILGFETQPLAFKKKSLRKLFLRQAILLQVGIILKKPKKKEKETNPRAL